MRAALRVRGGLPAAAPRAPRAPLSAALLSPALPSRTLSAPATPQAPEGQEAGRNRGGDASSGDSERAFLAVYRRQLRLLEQWPKDEDREGRNLHDFLNRRVRKEYARRRDALANESRPERRAAAAQVLLRHAEGQRKALQELFENLHKDRYPLDPLMGRAVESRARMRKILSTEHQRKKAETRWQRLFKRMFPSAAARRTGNSDAKEAEEEEPGKQQG
jgi:Complex III assembly factor UQCC2/CBP6